MLLVIHLEDVYTCGQSRWFGVDPVLIDLHKLRRKCLMKATRHGSVIDESTACYVRCSRPKMRSRFAPAVSWLNKLPNPELTAVYDEIRLNA